MVRISAEGRRGGLVVHFASSSMLEIFGLHRLEGIRTRLSPPDRKEAIRMLLEIEGRKEAIDAIIARTEEYMSVRYSLLERIWGKLYELFSGLSGNGMMKSANASNE